MAWRLHKFKSPDDCCRIPVRYAHTPIAMWTFQDYQAAKELVIQLIKNLDADKIQALVQPLSKVEQMKIYVSCDIEGLAGIATFDMEKDTVLFRELYHQHVAWLIEGIQRVPK